VTQRELQGKPSNGFVFDDLDVDVLRARRTLKWSRYGPEVLAAWVAEMDFPTAPVVQAAIANAVRREQFGYPVDDVDTGLRQAVAAWSEEHYGWAVDLDRVHLLPDVLRGVELAIEFFSPPGSPVILPTPAYMPFFRVPGMVERDIIQVPLLHDGTRYSLDLDGIGAAFAAGGGALILCHPYNPVGRVFSRQELEALAQVVDQHGGRVISDEIHAPLTYPGAQHLPYASLSDTTAAHTLTFTAATKAWNLPGLKCAVAITSSDADEKAWQDIAGHTHGASSLGIEASVSAFTDGRPWLDAALAYLDVTRNWFAGLLDEHLPLVRYTPPEATYLAWLDCRELKLPVEPAEFFLDRAKVAVNAGPSFGAPAQGFVRLNLATSRSLLERMVTAMGAAIPEP